MLPISEKHSGNTPRSREEDDVRFLTFRSLVDREVYEYYRENRRRQSKTIDQYNYFIKAVEGLFIVISRMIAESEAGVYIEGFGYFCCIKNIRKTKPKSLTLRSKYKISYTPFFFPDKEFQHWRMDGTFKDRLKGRVRNSKIEHRVYFDVCESYREAATKARVFTNNKKANRKR